MPKKISPKELEQKPANELYELALTFEKMASNANYLLCLNLASQKDHPLAKYELGCRYLEGEIVQKDSQKAINLLEESSALNGIKAKTKLATIYNEEIEEIEVEQNFEKAQKLLSDSLNLAQTTLEQAEIKELIKKIHNTPETSSIKPTTAQKLTTRYHEPCLIS